MYKNGANQCLVDVFRYRPDFIRRSFAKRVNFNDIRRPPTFTRPTRFSRRSDGFKFCTVGQHTPNFRRSPKNVYIFFSHNNTRIYLPYELTLLGRSE